MNSKGMLLRLLRLGLLSLLFVHQTRPALSIIEESVKELIVERPAGTYDSFTVNMKPNRTCGVVGSDRDTFCNTLGANLLEYTLDRSSCKCQCFIYQPFYLSVFNTEMRWRCNPSRRLWRWAYLAYIMLAFIRLHHYHCAVVSFRK